MSLFFPPWGLPTVGNFKFPPVLFLTLFPCVGASHAKEFQSFPPVGASQARQFEIISNSLIISPNLWKYRYLRCFFTFSWPTQTQMQKTLPKHCFSQCFYHVSLQKQSDLHVFRHKVGPKHKFSMLWHPKTFQCIAIYNVFSLFVVFALPATCQNDPNMH